MRISKVNRLTSIADFISSRYGKSALLGGLVTIIATLGVVPYIALQLKAVSTSITILLRYPQVGTPTNAPEAPLALDTAFYVALVLAAFSIVFGTRHLDATERHEGMVAAIAFESLVKLLAFLAVGVFVTFGLYQGFGDLTDRAAASPDLAAMLTIGGPRPGAAGPRSPSSRCWRSFACRASSRSRSWRTWTSSTSTARCGSSHSTCWRSTSSSCRSPSAAC